MKEMKEKANLTLWKHSFLCARLVVEVFVYSVVSFSLGQNTLVICYRSLLFRENIRNTDSSTVLIDFCTELYWK